MIIKTTAAIMENEDKRTLNDRRTHSFKTLTYGGLSGRGRRRQARRNGDNYYLDYYSPQIFFMGVALLVLSGLDAFFTMRLMERGAYEANVIMAYFMSINMNVFIIVKIGLTMLGTLALATHAHFHLFRIITGKQLLGLMMCIYSLLICYEVVLLGR